MPTRITNFLHDSLQTGAETIGTAFTLTAVHEHDLTAGLPDSKQAVNFRGIVEGVHIRLTAGGAPSATKLTMRICADAAGDYTLVPDTEADLVAGLTTTTSQCVAFSVQLPLFQILSAPGNGSLYLFVKVNNATTVPTFAQSCITWRE